MRASSLRRLLGTAGLLASTLCGCAAFRPIKGVPVGTLPVEYKLGNRSGLKTIDLSLLRQTPPRAHLIDSGDVLAVYIEGELGKDTDPPPVHFPTNNETPATFGLPVPVREDGTISLPKVGAVMVRGMTLVQAEQHIRQVYSYPRQLLLPDTRIQLSLQRPRHYRVLVIRQDSQSQSLGGVETNGLNLGMIRKGTGKVVSLPAYENDVLNALAATEGLPGADAENACYVIRRRGLRAGGTLGPGAPPGMGAMMGLGGVTNLKSSKGVVVRGQSPHSSTGSLHSMPLEMSSGFSRSQHSLHEPMRLDSLGGTGHNVGFASSSTEPRSSSKHALNRVDQAYWQSTQAPGTGTSRPGSVGGNDQNGVVQAGAWTINGEPSRFGQISEQTALGQAQAFANGESQVRDGWNASFDQQGYRGPEQADYATRMASDPQAAARASQLVESGDWNELPGQAPIRNADYGPYENEAAFEQMARQIGLSRAPMESESLSNQVNQGASPNRFSVRPQFEDSSAASMNSRSNQGDVVPQRQFVPQPSSQGQQFGPQNGSTPFPVSPGRHPSLSGDVPQSNALRNSINPAMPHGGMPLNGMYTNNPFSNPSVGGAAPLTGGRHYVQPDGMVSQPHMMQPSSPQQPLPYTAPGSPWNAGTIEAPLNPVQQIPIDRGHSEWGPFGLDGRHVVRIPLRLAPGEVADITERDIFLEDGDIVFIESRETEVFFTGGLLGGGQYTLPRDYDLDILQAISIATSRNNNGGARTLGGVSALNNDVTISPSTVIVLRKLPDGTEVPIKVDLYRARTCPDERVVIQPGDYILLQYTPIEAVAAFLERHLLEGALFSLAAQNFTQNGN